MIDFVKPTEEALVIIARGMREADKKEVWASHNLTPLEALKHGVETSQHSAVVVGDGKPFAVLGLTYMSLLGGTGSPWLLATDDADSYRREFILQSKAIIDEMLHICPRLCNMVHVENKKSILWLKRIGFTMCEPEIYGPEKELFHKFYMVKEG